MMFKLVLEKAEEPEIRLPTSAGSWKKQESSRKTSTSALLTVPKPLTVWITINWKILKEMGIPDHLTCLQGYLCAGQEATARTGHDTTDWFQIDKGVRQGYIYCHLAYLNHMQSTSYEMPGWINHKLELKIARRNINNLRQADDATIMAESEEELKSLLMRVKKESEKAVSKLIIQKN